MILPLQALGPSMKSTPMKEFNKVSKRKYAEFQNKVDFNTMNIPTIQSFKNSPFLIMKKLKNTSIFPILNIAIFRVTNRRTINWEERPYFALKDRLLTNRIPILVKWTNKYDIRVMRSLNKKWRGIRKNAK